MSEIQFKVAKALEVNQNDFNETVTFKDDCFLFKNNTIQYSDIRKIDRQWIASEEGNGSYRFYLHSQKKPCDIFYALSDEYCLSVVIEYIKTVYHVEVTSVAANKSITNAPGFNSTDEARNAFANLSQEREKRVQEEKEAKEREAQKKIEREKREAQERIERAERQRLENERRERERIERVEKKRVENEKRERERIEREKREAQERTEREKREAQERMERERVQTEKERSERRKQEEFYNEKKASVIPSKETGLHFYLYNNLGNKIKIMAKVILWFGIIGAVVGGLSLSSTFAIAGISVLIGGSLSAVVASMLLYACGIIVENSEIRTNLALMADMEREKESK